MKRLIQCGLFAVLLFGAVAVTAQVGGVRGTVMDQDFEVPLPGVKVRISETDQEVESGEGGAFFLENVEPGSYTLMFSKSGYTRVTKPEVVVLSGRLAEADASLAGEYEEMDELVVRDIQLGGASEIGLLNLRMDSVAMMDSVGADLMSKAGASDAAGALKLVAGATVQDGKYAVVRGLPDRYVNSQMNGVRLPSADPDKRAVQLDQFPSAMIESIQVAKTFTPDQQGDASGGAVNVVLKGVPDETILAFKAGTKYRTTVNGEDFLTYEGGGLDYLGDNGDRYPQPTGRPWTGAVGVKKGDPPFMNSWNLVSGGTHTFDTGVKVGGFANFYYKHDASNVLNGRNDKYWVDGGVMKPQGVQDANGDGIIDVDFKTSLFDIQQSTDEVQWGGLGVLGVESERSKLKLLYMRTHISEDKVTLAEDTRGKQYVYPGYNPYNTTRQNVEDGKAPYRRSQTIEYQERDTDTLQFSGEHTLPFPELSVSELLDILEPKFGWMYAKSTSKLNSPDKRLFSSLWSPGYADPGFPPFLPPSDVPPAYGEDKSGDAAALGNVQRIWKNIEEDSDQIFLNATFPFEQWTGDEGFLKGGYFKDKVTRDYFQDTYSNFKEGQPDESSWIGGRWDQYWSDVFPLQGNPIDESFVDVNYHGDQDIDAWYYMADVPLSGFLKVTGGVRYESTRMNVSFDAEKDVQWTDKEGIAHSFRDDPPPIVPIDQDDVLPSIGLEFSPLDTLTFRGSYSETVARPTFKEFTPIRYQEYVGGDVFIGNSALKMSAVDNYDLRMDYRPYPGSLISFSWFYKDIENPIEYTQDYGVGVGLYTTAVNYPDGTLSGYEMEIRQSLGQFWDPLEGLSIGANLTLLDSEVTGSDYDVERLAALGYPERNRDMLFAPDYIYNLNATYDIARFGTQLGLFYVVQGDTLTAGAGNADGFYVPSVYAREYGTLNFSISQKVGDHLKFSFKAKNLTNPEIEEVYRSDYLQGDVLKSSYSRGIEYAIDVTATW